MDKPLQLFFGNPTPSPSRFKSRASDRPTGPTGPTARPAPWTFPASSHLVAAPRAPTYPPDQPPPQTSQVAQQGSDYRAYNQCNLLEHVT